jgi:pimeloyl-ACP methyl ester carboxylesterase
MWMRWVGAALTAWICVLAGAHAAGAQSAPAYVPLGPAAAALYKPDSGPAPHVGILVIHRTADYMRHVACTQFAQRGFMVLCVNTRYVNNEGLVRFEQIALDVKAGVEFLRRQPGITKVVLFGHSGGGPTVSFYQAVAENGIAYCTNPKRLTNCDATLANLPRADGIVFADSHPGNPVNVLRGLNPAVLNENDPPDAGSDPALDAFDPKNGYNPAGPSHYTPEFQRRYFAAQSARMNRLIERSQAKLALMKAGTYGFPDDDIVVIPRGGNPGSGPGAAAGLFALDPSIGGVMSTVRPEKLLRNDGTIVTQAVHSVYVPDLKLKQLHYTFGNGTKILSIRSFLSANAVRSTNALDGIDDCSSNNSTICAVQSIAVPELFAAMGAHYFVRDVEREYDLAASKDKDYVVIEGSTHGFTPCTACETTPGQYSNTLKNLFDYIAAWIAKRY